MLSTKTLATLLLFTLNMQLAASSGTQEPDPSSTSTLLVKKSKSKPTSKPVLKDETDTTKAVQAAEMSAEEVAQVQEQPVPQVNKEFDELFKQGKYDELFGHVESMGQDEFMKQFCLIVKTHGQYKKVLEYLKDHKMVALFYVHGDIGVVREAIFANSSVYDGDSYVDGGDLETALPLALNSDCYDRVIELLNVRQEVTAEKDKLAKQKGRWTSFESFVFYFLGNIAPWEDDMTLRRFLAHCEEEFRTGYFDILDTLCEKLVEHLRSRLDKPKAVSLLTDMIGQPSLLTTVSFTKGFLHRANDDHRSDFIKYGWAEALQEGLKEEYWNGGEELWRVMEKEHSDRPPERFPEIEEERAIACKQFPTKQQKEEEWRQFALKNATILFTKLESLDFISDLIPKDLPIITGYAISMADIDSTVSRK